MRVAHDRITGGRDAQGNREKRLLANPGPVHAMDAVGTRDGDPWNGEVVPGAVHFFGGSMNSGPRAACGRMHMRAVLGDEFVPQEEPTKWGQCPRCAELVAEGKGFRNPPGDWYDPFCSRHLQVKIDDTIEVQDCSLRGDQRGPHRTRHGATWDIGFDDFVLAPLDTNRRIAKVPDAAPPEPIAPSDPGRLAAWRRLATADRLRAPSPSSGRARLALVKLAAE